MTNYADLAKFFSGFAANQVLTHAVLASQGVQFTLFGFAYTPSFNAAAASVWAAISLSLGYYGWSRRTDTDSQLAGR